MHEWALADAILRTAKEIAEQEKLRKVTVVTIGAGELQHADLEILQFALAQLKSDIFADSQFHITKSATMLKCRVCENTWRFDLKEIEERNSEAIHFVPEAAHAYITCPRCGSPDFIIASGRGVWLENIEGAR